MDPPADLAQPVFAKVTDTVGRWEAFCASAALYTLGYVIVAASPNVGAYAVGQCLYQVRSRPSRAAAERTDRHYRLLADRASLLCASCSFA